MRLELLECFGLLNSGILPIDGHVLSENAVQNRSDAAKFRYEPAIEIGCDKNGLIMVLLEGRAFPKLLPSAPKRLHTLPGGFFARVNLPFY